MLELMSVATALFAIFFSVVCFSLQRAGATQRPTPPSSLAEKVKRASEPLPAADEFDLAGDGCFSFIVEQEISLENSKSNTKGAASTIPFGETILDAGTGTYSLKFIRYLCAKGDKWRAQHIKNRFHSACTWTALTADPKYADTIKNTFLGGSDRNLRGDKVVLGKWRDEELFKDDTFDIVLVDYLLGAIEGFDPYWQTKMFPRLKQVMHSKSRMYFVGMEPIPFSTADPHGNVILAIARVRDACALLTGVRPYREYPLEWVLDQLKVSGFDVVSLKVVPIAQDMHFVLRQLRVARRFLEKAEASSNIPLSASEGTIKAMYKQIDQLHSTVTKMDWNGVQFGTDYTVMARPQDALNGK